MALVDWTIFGGGGIAIVDEGGSKRCQLTGDKTLLWSERGNLINSEIIADEKFYTNDYRNAVGLLLRSNANATNCYRLLTYASGGERYHQIQKIVNDVVTNLGAYTSTIAYNVYLKTRFRVDGYQLSLGEFIDNQWKNMLIVEDTSQSLANGYNGFCAKNISYPAWYVWLDNISINEREI